MSLVAKIIEVIGISNREWEDAAQIAVTEAKKTVHGIHGIKVQDMTADGTARAKSPSTRPPSSCRLELGTSELAALKF